MTQTVIQTQDLTITHLKDLKDLVKDLTVTINRGDKVALIGEEGNGKTTLLKAFMTPEDINSYAGCSGTVSRHFSSFAYLPQSLPKSERQLTLNAYIFGDNETFLDYTKLYRFAAELDFDSDRFATDQLLGSLSGGEMLKVQLIKKLSSEAEVIFLDEPSNDLDLQTLLWLETFIQESNQTIIFVSHDEALLSQTANKLIHLERIKKRAEARSQVQNLDYENYKDQRDQSYHRDMKRAKKERTEHEASLAENRRQKQILEHQLRTTKDSTAGRLLAKKMKNVLSHEKCYQRETQELTEIPIKEEAINLHFDGIAPLPASKTIVRLENFELTIDDRNLSQGISLTVKGQDKIGIIGRNGIGKSTLLKTIFNQLKGKPDLKVAYMPQDYDSLLDVSQTPLHFLNPSGELSQETRILSHLALLNFTREEARHPIAQLSGGQRAKLLLLNLVLAQPQVLLLDEPSRNISPTSQPELRQLFTQFPGAILAVSHDRLFLREVCDRYYEIRKNGLIDVDSLD
ncbi:ATP-binding cassette domain-containing protein [Streptococcus merionis]|uniref:ATP-binding cassette domain-containing protein n=1 Tax=Streptococcus merionis TaxID=400065 RepID=UPI0035197346